MMHFLYRKNQVTAIETPFECTLQQKQWQQHEKQSQTKDVYIYIYIYIFNCIGIKCLTSEFSQLLIYESS